MKNWQEYIHIPIILIACWLISIILKAIFNKFIENRKSLLSIDPTNFYFLRSGINFVLYTAAIAIILLKTPGFQDVGTTIFASAGIMAAIVGFASKEAFSNIVSGIFIIIFKPFRVGDMLEFEAGQRGTVEDITLRHTIIKDLNNKRVIIPNSTMSSESIINYHISDSRILYYYSIGISYESDVDKAIAIIREKLLTKQDVLDWVEDDGKKREDKLRIRITELYDSGVTIRADYWCESFDISFDIACQLNKELLLAFKDNDIEIPYPHRTIVYKDQDKKETK